MRLPFFIAKRYLFAKKSHNVINIISLISAIGITIGTAALVVVLSVYNGFEDLVKGIYGSYESDLVITPATGKVFSPRLEEFDRLKADERVQNLYEVLEENVFVVYDKAQGIAFIKGVDTSYSARIRPSSMIEGDFDLQYGEISQAVVGRSLAREMGIRPRFLDPLEVYFPARGQEVSLTNPLSSLRMENLFPVGVISIEQNLDKQIIFLPIKTARHLLDYTDQVSSIEVMAKPDIDVAKLQTDVINLLGDNYIVKNKYQQNETVYKMMTYEKVAIYMILLFIIIVVSCNMFGSLTMLRIEKKDDIEIMRSMGARDKLINRIFVLEGWLIILSGIAVGAIIGVLLCLVQQNFGLIKMPGNFIIKNYPVIINVWDILLTIGGVSLVGLFLLLPSYRPSHRRHNRDDA